MTAAIFALAGPTMLEQLLQTAVQYVDTAMVGSLGTQATAAVGSTGTVNWLISSTISAVGVGLLAYISRALGEGDRSKARAASGQAVLMVLLVGAFFTALTLSLSPYVPVWMKVEPQTRKLAGQYFFIIYSPMLFRAASIIFGTVLRAAGDTKTPLKVGILVNAVNVSLNFFLIYPSRQVRLWNWICTIPGAGWGIYGAAAATAAAFLLGGVCITWALWHHPDVSPKGQRIKPVWAILQPCLRVAWPNALQRFGTSFGYVVFASMINALGDVSTAAHTIANTVESAFYIPGYGMQTAAATLAGNALGEGNAEKLKKLGRSVLRIEILLMILSGGLLFLLAPWMVGVFSENEQVILLGAAVLRMVALSEPFYGVSIVIEGMLQGMGRTVFPLAVNIMGMWLVRILGTFICTELFDMGLIAAWACMIGHNLIISVVYSVFYGTGCWNPFEKREKIKNNT